MTLKDLVTQILSMPEVVDEDDPELTISPEIVARDSEGNWYNVNHSYLNEEDDMVICIERMNEDA